MKIHDIRTPSFLRTSEGPTEGFETEVSSVPRPLHSTSFTFIPFHVSPIEHVSNNFMCLGYVVPTL